MKQRQSARLVKASDVIVDGIRDRILHERLPVGSPLPSESELMEDYGLGRVTVRESLRLLERDGIVSIRRGPGGGVFVGTPDIQRLSEVFTVLMAIRDVSLRDLLEFRKIIEPPAARLAALNATDEQRAALLAATEHPGNPVRNADVHLLIAEATNNPILAMAFYAVSDNAAHYPPESLNTQPVFAATHQAHQAIAAAIVAGKPLVAQRAMSAHLAELEAAAQQSDAIDEPLIRGKAPATGRR